MQEAYGDSLGTQEASALACPTNINTVPLLRTFSFSPYSRKYVTFSSGETLFHRSVVDYAWRVGEARVRGVGKQDSSKLNDYYSLAE